MCQVLYHILCFTFFDAVCVVVQAEITLFANRDSFFLSQQKHNWLESTSGQKPESPLVGTKWLRSIDSFIGG